MVNDKDILQIALEYTDSMMYGDADEAEKSLEGMASMLNVRRDSAWEYARAELIRKNLDREYDLTVLGDYGMRLAIGGHDRDCPDEEMAKGFKIESYLFHPDAYSEEEN
ncbi:MAG: hypothetical protein ABIB71_02600 [Candidatus Woesearchaeota archaeon]